jgi:hypothetical protein
MQNYYSIKPSDNQDAPRTPHDSFDDEDDQSIIRYHSAQGAGSFAVKLKGLFIISGLLGLIFTANNSSSVSGSSFLVI